jgi:hypothetical protein
MIFAMERMIAMITRMKKKSFVGTFRVISYQNSNVVISSAFQISSYVMEKMTVEMEQTRTT